MDCCDLRLTFGAVSKTYSDLSIQFRTVTKARTVLWGYGQARRFHAQYGSVMNVWIEDSDHIFGTDDGHLVLDPVEYILCTHFTLYFVYRIQTCFTKNTLLSTIISLFSTISQYFPDTMVFSIPFQRLPTLQGGPYASKARHVSGPRDMGLIFCCSEWDFIHYFIHYIFPKRFLKIDPGLQLTNVQDVSKLPEFGWEHLQLKPLCLCLFPQPAHGARMGANAAAGCGEVYG